MPIVNVELPKGISIRGNSLVAKLSVTIDGGEIRKSKAFPFFDDPQSNKQDNILVAKKKAIMWKAETTEAYTLGKEVSVDQTKEMTLEEGADYTYTKIWAGNKCPDTPMTNIRICSRFFGSKVLLKDISGIAMNEFIQMRRDLGKADSTINRQITSLSTVIKTCWRDGYYSKDGKIPPKMPLSKEYNQRNRYWTSEEEYLFYDECKQRGDNYIIVADMVLLSMRGGLRRGEVFGLEVRDCFDDPVKEMMHITLPAPMTKSNQTRNVTVMGMCRKMMLNRMVGLSQSETIFGQHLTIHGLTHRFNTIKGKMGLGLDDQFIFHVVRHTNLTRLSEKGMQPKSIMEWAGHQDLKTTMRYIHPSKLHLESGANMMSMYDLEPKKTEEKSIKNNQLSLVKGS